MRSRLGVLLVLAALVVGVPAALGGSSRAAANSQTFPDSIGEDASAPDITSVVVSNDDAGNITFTINISNRPALTPDMFLIVFLDTDQNASTGDPDALGADYVIQLVPGAVDLFQWNGSDYVRAAVQTSLTFVVRDDRRDHPRQRRRARQDEGLQLRHDRRLGRRRSTRRQPELRRTSTETSRPIRATASSSTRC